MAYTGVGYRLERLTHVSATIRCMGLAVASRWTLSPELASGQIEAVLADWTLPSVDLWAAFPSGRLVTAKARAFVAFVEESLAGLIRRRPSGIGARQVVASPLPLWAGRIVTVKTPAGGG
jgi:hypothetical protein